MVPWVLERQVGRWGNSMLGERAERREKKMGATDQDQDFSALQTLTFLLGL